MCISDDGREMVLAVTYESNAGKHDGFVVAACLAEAPRKQGDRILAIAPEQFLVGADDPRGRIAQPLPVRIGAGPGDERTDRRLGGDPAGTPGSVGVLGRHTATIAPEQRHDAPPT